MKKWWSAAAAGASCLLLLGCASPARVVESDLCVYGGTSAGLAAAVQAARMGKTVVVVEPGIHLGGLSSGGLGATDIGNKKAIGGISREFYRRLGKRYGKDEAWTFEPHVAEETFAELVEEAKVKVDIRQGVLEVRKAKDRIFEIETRGEVIRSKVYIDATYEGDLLAKAGVSFTVGREANAKYGETLNGVRGETPKHQFQVAVDPYVKPGDPSSGLLPFIEPEELGTPGDGDRRVQAYNFRLCLTRDPANRVPIDPPVDYAPARYEVLARYLEALVGSGHTPKLAEFLSITELPHGKTDMNNNGPFSTDFLGRSWKYPQAGPEERFRIRKEHEDYTRGFLHFLATSPRVPEGLRTEMMSWGLARDEFPMHRGWPHQLYIRESRRMVSDHVMTEHDCRGEVKAADPVGLGAYGMDSHNVRRIVRNGRVENEGDVQVPVRSPYPISYRSIVPRRGECGNLLVPVCLSASHIAYGSIRMEPVFMILGQSAAAAACLAIDAGCAVQEVDYPKLRARLLEDGQVLEWKD